MSCFRNVIDTSYLYSIAGETGAAPSLRDISSYVLGVKMPTTHDSTDDAKASLEAALYYLTHPEAINTSQANNINTIEIPRLTGNQASDSQSHSSLFVHRIPSNITEDMLMKMFIEMTYVCPLKVNPIQRGTSSAPSSGSNSKESVGKTYVSFSSKAHMELALESIEGPNRPDKANRVQKRVYMQGGGYICVRLV